MNNNSRLADSLKVYKECKEELKPFSVQVQKFFSTKLFEYVSKDSCSSKKKLILEILNEMLDMNYDTTPVFQLLLKMQYDYTGRDLLMGFLDEFIVCSGIEEPYKLFLDANKM